MKINQDIMVAAHGFLLCSAYPVCMCQSFEIAASQRVEQGIKRVKSSTKFEV